MTDKRIALPQSIVIASGVFSEYAVEVTAMPGADVMKSSSGDILILTTAITMSEAAKLLGLLPLSERADGWRSLWQSHYEAWLGLSPSALADWISTCLLQGEMYPLLYPVRPQSPSLECIALLSSVPKTFEPVRNTAIELCFTNAERSSQWRLLHHLFPLIGRFQPGSLLPRLLAFAENASEVQAIEFEGENLFRSLFRCLVSFSDPSLTSVLANALSNSVVSDICFTELARLREIQDDTRLELIARQFADDSSYVLVLFSRFLEQVPFDGLAALEALQALRQIAQDATLPSLLRQGLSDFIGSQVQIAANPQRSPSRAELQVLARLKMSDIQLNWGT